MGHDLRRSALRKSRKALGYFAGARTDNPIVGCPMRVGLMLRRTALVHGLRFDNATIRR